VEGNTKGTVLVVDDERSLLDSLQKTLDKEGYRVLVAERGSEALELMSREPIEVVLSDVKMPEMDGLELLRVIKKKDPDVEVVLFTGYGTIELAVEAMKEGAYDFITKPFKRVHILKTVEKAFEKRSLTQENKYLRDQLEGSYRFDKIVGESRAIKDVMGMVERVAALNSNVLIIGESGTGKELVARAIHFNSPRRRARFVPINCGAIPENLIESELFGHVRGAFTGAMRDKEGLFKTAAGGTLFLDEIGNVPLHLQVKLLRAIEEKEILPVGSTRSQKIDARIIAASNKDLSKEVEKGTFREDLFYRLNVVEIRIPPLRDRREDIPLLVDHFIRIHNQELKKQIRGLDDRTLDILMNYPWKGNVRELDNVIERAMILCDDELIQPHHLPQMFAGVKPTTVVVNDLKESVREFERRQILQALEQTNFDKRKTAKLLGLSQSSLYRKMAELDIKG